MFTSPLSALRSVISGSEDTAQSSKGRREDVVNCVVCQVCSRRPKGSDTWSVESAGGYLIRASSDGNSRDVGSKVS